MLTTEALMPTLSRDAMEAHLRLQEWVPVSYGAVGARRGRLIIYVYRVRQALGDYTLEDGHASIGPDMLPDQWDVDDWYQSDPLFARLVKAISEHDSSAAP